MPNTTMYMVIFRRAQMGSSRLQIRQVERRECQITQRSPCIQVDLRQRRVRWWLVVETNDRALARREHPPRAERRTVSRHELGC